MLQVPGVSAKKNTPFKYPPIRFNFEEETKLLPDDKSTKSRLTVPSFTVQRPNLKQNTEYSASKCKYPPLIFDISEQHSGSAKKNTPSKYPPLQIDFEEEKQRLLQDEIKSTKTRLTVPSKTLSSNKKTTGHSEKKTKFNSNQKTGVASSSKNIHRSTQKIRKSLPKSRVRKSLFNSKKTAGLCVMKSKENTNYNSNKEDNQELFDELLAAKIQSSDESIGNMSSSSSEFLLLEEKCGINSSKEKIKASPKESFNRICHRMENEFLEFEKLQKANMQNLENLCNTMKQQSTEFLRKYRANLKKVQTINKKSPGGKENRASFPSPGRVLRSAAKSNTLREKIFNRNLTKNLSQRTFNILKNDCESTSSSQIQKQCFLLMETPSRK